MASTSSIQKSFKYDVFLSFRGEDTRKNFVDHLYHALHQKGIITYKDDEKIQKGERISDELIRSIEESKFYIIVFSKNYASSSWCLDELVKIIECQKKKEQTAYPIFFDVEPTEVRHQSGAVGKAFVKHERGTWSSALPLDCICSVVVSCCNKCSILNGFIADSENEDDVARWRSALKDAAGLVGWELKNTVDGHEANFIQQIVKDISLKLHFINSSIDGKLVGMDTRVKSVVSSLETDSDDVRMIGIKGIGGGGKTTLARAVFDLISVWFEAKSFVENVKEVSKGSVSGLKELQKQVLSDVLNDQSIIVTGVSDGKIKMKRMMPSRKVLVVLDDVDDINQLEALAGELTWFRPGSRIIITTRDKQVLLAHGVNIIHDVNLLSDEEAICLFNKQAFKRDIPNQGYEKLSRKVIHYAAGLPLTIKVLGSHLFGRNESEWVDAIERLAKIPLEKTLKRLEISYDGLENDQKEIFLDVVCLLKGESKDKAIRVLQSCGLNAQIGLNVLDQRSLITISYTDRLGFHDHVEEMGFNIVRRMYPDQPSRHSRLWIKEKIEDILVSELGTEATRSIKLQHSILHPEIIMKGFRNMKELQLLNVVGVYKNFDEVINKYLPDALKSLCWFRYPFQSLPGTFQANKLVILEMRNSNISELWEGGKRKVLNNLKFLDLSFSKLRTFDLSMTPHLEEFNLEGCGEFVDLHLSIECRNLKVLKLSGSKVCNLDLGLTPQIQKLYLEGCSYLQQIQAPMGCLKNLDHLHLSGWSSLRYFEVKKDHVSNDLDSLAMLEIDVDCISVCPQHPLNSLPSFSSTCILDEPRSSYSGKLEKFFYLGPCACENLEYILATICGIQNLRVLTLKGFTPRDPWRLESLEELSLSDQQFQNLPHSICMLKHLKSLQLYGCSILQQLPGDICRLECLEELIIWDCESLRDIPNSLCKMRCLKRLELPYCHNIMKLPEELGSLQCLKVLDIEGTGISLLPQSIYQLKGLRICGLREQLELYGFKCVTKNKFSFNVYWVEL